MPFRYRCFDTANEEADIATVHRLMKADLSEPYSNVVYFYFLKNWPELTIFVIDEETDETVGVIVGSLKTHKERRRRGYVGMLAIDKRYRGRGLAKKLIDLQVEAFRLAKADEVTLETECSNIPAISLYESQGFVRTRRMHRYYFNTSDAFRLVLPLTERSVKPLAFLPALLPSECVPPEQF